MTVSDFYARTRTAYIYGTAQSIVRGCNHLSPKRTTVHC